ncbi:Glucose 1-dehydrogenase 1 [Paraburkholderia domus]|jgi:NAD(P)-dependent dehydrogenase (short-subunit alcohol dehydrogenase family)|uniref:Glucose 1-dehydrogenase 1 n=1 Tax=Paraburkholderia domus TaxID=2793075 RepID=A0A9N8MK06_9BURK|nr:SDR family oxidoreductase [Paraburkholderia domus]MBK5047509.1 SDR family oxidoreductase [Burkholderia sp. R-70006]MBK5062872.1 SDR family oxidoreductase [Burkholderia sp. R-70199]MBK5085005.1 SDR family oxidoreductase [Burkholderia sp. R-69927]MBK5119678.1 SDR family oxidoreductase [Burkholderia sp. R-69980]MBK5164079.1 SDR family oxidoreductase [Burkholderia sp. R-70211]MBK5178899.1 SDR family oxidoreductase [Burkholderia sp. R-69749]MCI0148614.1 SDR family oxidoreductase [Paraburkholde
MTASLDTAAARAPETPRIVLITGAARRIGRSLALGFAARGWDVAVHYGASREEADEVVAEIAALGRRAVALHAELGDEAQVKQLIPACMAALGRPACIVNNASRFEEDTAQNVGYDLLLKLTAMNLGAPVVLARMLFEATPEAARTDESQRGVVINVLDQKLYNMNPDYLSYTLSKAALQTATVALAQALAPKVRVVGLAPGLTMQSADQTPAGFEEAHRATPLGRASRPEDIVAAALYLADAAGVTGTTLVVDGGQHLVPLPRDVMFLTGA